MIKQIILASNNQHKVDEIKAILSDLDIEIKSLKDADIDIEVEEDGATFEENSKKKASEIAEYLKARGESEFIVMADDSGLAVDYLKGAPGIYSARYAGVHGDDKANNKKLLRELDGVRRDDRTAKFVCVVTLVNDKGESKTIRGEAKGIIMQSLSGKGGFGYDPLFYYEPLGKTFSELTSNEKNKVSHRAVALNKLKDEIHNFM